jgi:hypothetical protein
VTSSVGAFLTYLIIQIGDKQMYQNRNTGKRVVKGAPTKKKAPRTKDIKHLTNRNNKLDRNGPVRQESRLEENLPIFRALYTAYPVTTTYRCPTILSKKGGALTLMILFAYLQNIQASITTPMLEDYEKYEFEDNDVIVKNNIGRNTEVTIKNASLTVMGNINDYAKITLLPKANNEAINTITTRSGFFASSTTVTISNSNNSPKHKLLVEGSIGNNAYIKSKNTDIVVKKDLGAKSSIISDDGHIEVGNVGAGTNIKNSYGDIKIGNVGAGTNIKNSYGDIKIGNVESETSIRNSYGNTKTKKLGEQSSINTDYGDINVEDVDAKATVHANYGNIKARDVSKGATLKSERNNIEVRSTIDQSSLNAPMGEIFINGEKQHKVNEASDANKNACQIKTEIKYLFTLFGMGIFPISKSISMSGSNCNSATMRL